MNDYVISEIELSCKVCGALTNRVDIHFETRICSEECCKVMTDDYLEVVKLLKDN